MQTTLEVRDTETKCTHLMLTFKERKQKHQPDMKSAVREEGGGMSGPIGTGHLKMQGRKASVKGYRGAGA